MKSVCPSLNSKQDYDYLIEILCFGPETVLMLAQFMFT